jgi:bifunctional non-homologous end joining protein LigD
LDSKSKFETSKAVAEYICKLIRIKVPDLVALSGSDNPGYGKVSLDYLVNEEGRSVVAPYSLVYGESPAVAAPLLWEEVKDDLRSEDFNRETIFKRLKQIGDPFEALFKKRVNADTLLAGMETNYSFLF